jgi:hypothetical protein
MHPRATNKFVQAFDAYEIAFESAGALSSPTNTQGLPFDWLIYIAFEELNTACPYFLT